MVDIHERDQGRIHNPEDAEMRTADPRAIVALSLEKTKAWMEEGKALS